MLHINIIGVVTCSDNSTRRLVTWIFLKNSFHYHVTQFHRCNVSITIQEKTNIEQNAINCCNFVSCILMSCIFMPCNLVRHFHVRHFQRPLKYVVIKPRIFSPVARQPALTRQAVCTQIVVRRLKCYHPSMKWIRSPSTALWHILAVNIICTWDFDL